MNKICIIATGSLLALSTHAETNPSFCGYKDYFRISDSSHPAIYVFDGYNDSDVELQIVGPRSFVVKDTPKCHYGFAHVKVAYDQFNWCVLDIQDGPYMQHPTVHASCNGITYLGTTYDGFGSYKYTINLD